MTRALKIGSLLLAICATAAHAQLYKWTGPDGKVNYSDSPPPASASKVETKSLTIGDVSAGDFPFEVMEAMKNNPVTLYTTRNCIPCDDGRKHLKDRGIPFNEKTVTSNEDIAQLRKIGGDTNLPMLVVGRLREHGYEPNAWNSALTSGGYPETSRLPRSYRQPPAESVAPRPVVETKTDRAASDRSAPSRPSATELPPATGNAPPGFRF